MAKQEHLDILARGVGEWNAWRKDHHDVRPDLGLADLSRANLRSIDLSDAGLESAYLVATNFTDANLSGALLNSSYLMGAYLGGARLTGTNLSDADLRGASLGGADLCRAFLKRAKLNGADLRGADLCGADLCGADLTLVRLNRATLNDARLNGAKLVHTDLDRARAVRASFGGAKLSGTNFNGGLLTKAEFDGATVENAVFAEVDLSEVRGLEGVMHTGPSTVGLDTIYRSKGRIPEPFLRGCGVPENFIAYVHSLSGSALDFYSVFISYSSRDQAFAKRLHADLQARGVRCWFAPEDLKIGDRFRSRIDESIHIHDKLLLVLTKDSIRSPWVATEVETAFERERRENRTVLFPIRLDDAVNETNEAWAAEIRRTRHIGDFTKWEQHESYPKTLDRLLADLRAGPVVEAKS